VHTTTELERGRQSYARRAWADAFESLVQSEKTAALAAGDLELLATSAYVLGRDEEYVSAFERAHDAYLRAGEPLRAVRCAFWLGVNFALRSEMGQATGWLGRAQRLVEREERDCFCCLQASPDMSLPLTGTPRTRRQQLLRRSASASASQT
jgi:hypothetical protein